jgi:polyisoprenoid-binding protein YceI
MKMSVLLAAGALFCAPLFAAERACVVPGRGHFQIHVGTAGVFGAFAHDHLIDAKNIEGCASVEPNDLARSSVKLTFSTSSLKVIDPKEKAEDRAKVQRTMETEVLHSSEYPRVTFESTSVERAGSSNEFRIRGTLTIRGKAQPAVIPIRFTQLSDGTYRAAGEYRFKQTAFGIRPIKLGGGTVKVKDELRVDFEMFLK